jgi:hypothetical protein
LPPTTTSTIAWLAPGWCAAEAPFIESQDLTKAFRARIFQMGAFSL